MRGQLYERPALLEMARSLETDERRFAKGHPDYYSAALYFRAARSSELTDQGLSGALLLHALQQDFADTITRARRAGQDPAEVIYKLAMSCGFGAARH